MALLDLIDEYERPIEYDCIALGLRLRDLGTPQFSWGDFLVIVEQSPSTSALSRAMNPEGSAWGLQEQLLALIADYSAVANWQRSNPKTRKDYPRPIPRPGVKPDTQTWGKDALPMDEMKEWLGW